MQKIVLKKGKRKTSVPVHKIKAAVATVIANRTIKKQANAGAKLKKNIRNSSRAVAVR